MVTPLLKGLKRMELGHPFRIFFVYLFVMASIIILIRRVGDFLSKETDDMVSPVTLPTGCTDSPFWNSFMSFIWRKTATCHWAENHGHRMGLFLFQGPDKFRKRLRDPPSFCMCYPVFSANRVCFKGMSSSGSMVCKWRRHPWNCTIQGQIWT